MISCPACHDFLPDNFRELNHFIFYMTQMQDVIKEDRNGKSIGTIEHLLRRTVDYLEAYRQEEKKELIAEIDFQLNNLELFSNYFINSVNLFCSKLKTTKLIGVNLFCLNHSITKLRDVMNLLSSDVLYHLFAQNRTPQYRKLAPQIQK